MLHTAVICYQFSLFEPRGWRVPPPFSLVGGPLPESVLVEGCHGSSRLLVLEVAVIHWCFVGLQGRLPHHGKEDWVISFLMIENPFYGYNVLAPYPEGLTYKRPSFLVISPQWGSWGVTSR